MIFLINFLQFTSSLLSGWLVMRSMSYLITVSQKRPKRILLLFGCSLLCDMVIFIGDPFNILMNTFVFAVIVLLTCEGSFWQKITIGMMFSCTVMSFSALRDNYIHDFLFPTRQNGITVVFFRSSNSIFADPLLLSDHGYQISGTLILPFALLLYLGTRKFAPDKDYSLSDSMWRLLLFLMTLPLGIVIVVVALFPVSDYGFIDYRKHRECVFLLLIALFSFISLLWCITVLSRQRKLEQQSMFAEINRKYYEAMEQQHFEVRRLKHDLANHIQVFSALPEDKRAAYAKELSGNAAFAQSFAYCGDATVNAVLTVKKSVMERCHIRLKTEIDIPETLPYDKTELCALYANALDNAIEACLKLEEGQREISLKSKVGKGLFCLEISNPDPDAEKERCADRANKRGSFAAGEGAKHGALPPTSKQDQGNHGFGLQSIREIVKRYHGQMEIKRENGGFELFLYLPLA